MPESEKRMSDCQHAWGIWVKGRRTGYSFRACARCGQIEKSVPPEREEAQPELNIRGRMEKFSREDIAKRVRGNILDWRAKQAGE
jgi:hypothetical protein